MAIHAFLVEAGHQMACRPRFRGHLALVSESRTEELRDCPEVGLARETGRRAWRAER